MFLSLLIAALVGGAVIFVWGAISWMALPWHHQNFTHFENEDAMAAAITAGAPKSGLYSLPAPGCGSSKDPAAKKAAQEAAMARMKKGPMVFAVVSQEGFTSMGPYMVRGFLVGVAVSGLVAFLLMQTAIQASWKRAVFVGLAAMAGSLAARLNDWNWHRFPTRYTVVLLLDTWIGWCLAGYGIALVLPG